MISLLESDKSVSLKFEKDLTDIQNNRIKVPVGLHGRSPVRYHSFFYYKAKNQVVTEVIEFSNYILVKVVGWYYNLVRSELNAGDDFITIR